MEVFSGYAHYYNAFYQDKDYAGEAGKIDLLLRKYGKNIKKLINYGCGTGRHDIELTKLGYQCQGIDMSQIMVDIAMENARREKMGIGFQVADVRNYIPREKYDAVISVFHVMSYQNGNDDILAAFETARKAIESGGIFLFDAWYGPGVLCDKPTVRVKEAYCGGCKLVRIATPAMHDETNVVDVNYEVLVINEKAGTVKTVREVHSMRYFFVPEIKFYLEKAGFELLDNLDCATLGKTGYGSWTSYFIARGV